MVTYRASSFTKATEPDVLPGTPSVLMATYFALFYLSMVFLISKMGSQNKNPQWHQHALKGQKRETSFTKKHHNCTWKENGVTSNSFKALIWDKGKNGNNSGKMSFERGLHCSAPTHKISRVQRASSRPLQLYRYCCLQDFVR